MRRMTVRVIWALTISWAVAFAQSGHDRRDGTSGATGTDVIETAINTITARLAQTLQNSSVTKVAVLNFTDLNGYESAFGYFIAEELTTQLVGYTPGRLQVVERQQLSRILAEQQRTSSALFDQKNIAQVGKLLGVECLITGSITNFEKTVRLNARAVSVQSGLVFATAAAELPKTSDVTTLMSQSVPSTGAGAAQAASSPVQRSDVYFQNEFLRVEVASVGKSIANKSVTLTLRFQNTSREILSMAANPERRRFDCYASLVDNLGNSLLAKVSEVGCLRTVPMIAPASVPRPVIPSSLIQLGVGAGTAVPLTFHFEDSRKTAELGSTWSFSINMVRMARETPIQFHIGIAGIEIR
jgi:TolB-like protein